MPKISYQLDQDDIADAIRYWIESGSPKPKKKPYVLFHYDPPTGHPTDPGNGVTASIDGD